MRGAMARAFMNAMLATEYSDRVHMYSDMRLCIRHTTKYICSLACGNQIGSPAIDKGIEVRGGTRGC